MRFSTLSEWLAWQETLHPADIDLGLERIEQVMQRAGMYDRFACPLIIVAGTNGKGSVVATIEAIVREAGYRVCSYSSPHLLRYNERIRIDGESVGDAALCEAFARIDQARGEIALTYFEFGTLAAIDLFHRAAADLVVMEIGLGGRLDAVNVMQPDVSVITTIALDHTDWLGESREQIAREKAGVMRAGRPVIIGDREPPATLYQQADSVGAICKTLSREFSVQHEADGWCLQSDEHSPNALPLPVLAGEQQLDNAACAIVALQQIDHRVAMSAQQIADGLRKVQLSGRFQQLQEQPQVVVDVAHNEQAVAALVAQCQRQPVPGRTLVLLGMLADKPVAQVARLLDGICDEWHICGLEQAPRGLSQQQLARQLEPLVAGVKLHAHATVEQACVALLQQAGDDDRIVITGSFYTVADALRFFAGRTATID